VNDVRHPGVPPGEALVVERDPFVEQWASGQVVGRKSDDRQVRRGGSGFELGDDAANIAGCGQIHEKQQRRLALDSGETLRDVEIANGTLPRPEGAESVADMANIEAAFLDMDVAELEANAGAVKDAIEHVKALDQALSEAVGAGSSADFSPLTGTLKSMNQLLQQQLRRRGLASGAAATVDSEGGGGAVTGGAPAMSGPIQSREDVIRLLDQVSDWYSKYEPSSPVPLLLQRAKLLALGIPEAEVAALARPHGDGLVKVRRQPSGQ